ncbi:unnamed protein product, partial [Vitis vinifera]
MFRIILIWVKHGRFRAFTTHHHSFISRTPTHIFDRATCPNFSGPKKIVLGRVVHKRNQKPHKREFNNPNTSGNTFLAKPLWLLAAVSRTISEVSAADSSPGTSPYIIRLIGDTTANTLFLLPSAADSLWFLAGAQMVFKRFNGLVDELSVGRRVPPEPVTGVALKAATVEHRRFMSRTATAPAPAACSGGWLDEEGEYVDVRRDGEIRRKRRKVGFLFS